MPFVPLPPYSGTPPARGQQRANFNTNMEYAFEYMADLPYYINKTGASIEALAGDAEQAVTDATNAGSAQVALAEAQATIAQGHASDAQNSAAMAAAAANNHGDWSLLSGAFPAGEAVIHDGAVWISLDAIANVAASEPGVSADWFNYSDSIEGMSNPMTTEGDMIVGGAAGAPTRAAKGGNNTVWGVGSSGVLGYQTGHCGYGNAILLNNTHDLNTIAPPNTARGNARFSWTGGSLPANVPSGYSNAYMDMFSMGSGHEFRRQVIYARNSNNVIMRVSVDSGATWVESRGGGGISTAPVQTFTSANEVSNNITVTCDCTVHNHHPLDFNGSPLPSISGSYIINLTNLPTATTELVVGHIAARRIGRKSTVTIQASGFTVAWLATPSFQSGATGIDYIQYKIDPLFPTVLRLSQVYSRSS